MERICGRILSHAHRIRPYRFRLRPYAPASKRDRRRLRFGHRFRFRFRLAPADSCMTYNDDSQRLSLAGAIAPAINRPPRSYENNYVEAQAGLESRLGGGANSNSPMESMKAFQAIVVGSTSRLPQNTFDSATARPTPYLSDIV